MSNLVIGIVCGVAGIVLGPFLLYFTLACLGRTEVVVSDLRRRVLVARLRRQGWAEPLVPFSWGTLTPEKDGRGESALTDFVGAVYEPDCGLPVSQMTSYARRRQAIITEAWIKAVARSKREEAAPAGEPTPFEPSDSLA